MALGWYLYCGCRGWKIFLCIIWVKTWRGFIKPYQACIWLCYSGTGWWIYRMLHICLCVFNPWKYQQWYVIYVEIMMEGRCSCDEIYLPITWRDITGSRQHCNINAQLIINICLWQNSLFRRELVLLWYFPHNFNFYRYISTFIIKPI